MEGGGDENSGVTKLESGDFETAEEKAACLEKCTVFAETATEPVTGCETIFDQSNRGCYVHQVRVG